MSLAKVECMLYFTQICDARYHFLRRIGAHESVIGALAQADLKVLEQTANMYGFRRAGYIWLRAWYDDETFSETLLVTCS